MSDELPDAEGQGRDPIIGRYFGNYKAVGLLGRGGMGTVYVAEQTRIGKRVAIKVLHADCARDGRIVKRFFHEAELVNRIKHEHIIDIVDFGEGEQGVPYLVMELLEGTSLKQRLKQGPLDEPIARHVGAQVAQALSAAHAIKVIHRDLKPDNIFLVTRGDDNHFVKLLDFGVAKLGGDEGAQANLTRTGAVIGTPVYMSPEQIEGGEVGPQADLYALGCILFELRVGRPPFGTEGGLTALLKAHLLEAPPRPRTLGVKVSEDYEQVTLRCLAKPPEERYADALEVAAILARDSAGGPRAHPARNALQAGSPRTSARTRAALISGVVLVLSAALGVTWMLNQNHANPTAVPALARPQSIVARVPSPKPATVGGPTPNPLAPAAAKPAPWPVPPAPAGAAPPEGASDGAVALTAAGDGGASLAGSDGDGPGDAAGSVANRKADRRARLKGLKELYERKAISKTEYDKARRRILLELSDD